METFYVNEISSARYTATMKDETGSVIPGSSLTTLRLTLYDIATDTVLHSRDEQDVLNKNGVTVSEAGALVWILDPEDNEIITATKAQERHRAVFVAEWATGTKGLVHEFDLVVRNTNKAPFA